MPETVSPLIEVVPITVSCFVIGAILMALASRGIDADTRRQRWTKLASYFLIVHVVLGSAIAGGSWLIALTILLLAVGAWEMHATLRHSRSQLSGVSVGVWLSYAALSAALLASVANLSPKVVAYIYLVVASFDGFAQVTGQLLGRRPLAPMLSPGKTVEGLIGGIIGALIIAWATREIAGMAPERAIAVGIAIALCGFAGDLSASWVKRRAGVKDFSALLGAHGGVLDRFDSFIGAGGVIGPILLALDGSAS